MGATARWSVEFTTRARKDFRQLDRQTRSRVLDAMKLLSDDPRTASGVKRLQGREGYRLRVGDIRVIYEIVGDRFVVLVLRVAHRRDVYR